MFRLRKTQQETKHQTLKTKLIENKQTKHHQEHSNTKTFKNKYLQNIKNIRNTMKNIR